MRCTDQPKTVFALASRMRLMAAGLSLLALTACGGGGDGDGGSGAIANDNPVWQPNTYAASSTYAARCAAPRSGIDPSTGTTYADKRGSTVWENFWLRSWTHEFYLWYNEVTDTNPANYSSTEAYFDVLRTTATTSTGADKDRFHFTYPTDEWLALSQSGVSAGYGATWVVRSSVPPRELVVAYTEPNSPASSAGLTRGVKVLRVDGVDLVYDNTSAGVDTLNEGLWPSTIGQTHSFVVQELSGVQRTISLTAENVTSTPVQAVTTFQTGSGGTVGYLLFNDHIATAETGLINAFTQLKNANVGELILDIRYNGGGYLALASEVAYMIAGAGPTASKTFERLMFNAQYPSDTNPVTGAPNSPVPFYSTGNFSAPGTALPALNLSRVFVITGSGTCSASEAIINGLRGVGVEVVQIGSTTCGKPYGFYPKDNCGTTYFSIQFQGVNDQGWGHYADGFSPFNTSVARGEPLPGCSVADDYTHALGDAAEGRIAAALGYISSGGYCPAATGSSGRSQIQSYGASPQDEIVLKGPWRENRILQW